MKTNCWFVIAILVAGLAALAQADVRLPHLFGDHMLLQRELPNAVWGWAEPGEIVTVTIAGQTASATTGPFSPGCGDTRPGAPSAGAS